MDHNQQAAILKHVANGATWAEAAQRSGIHPEVLLQAVFDLRQGKRIDFAGFLPRLEAAGRRATENSLKSTRKSVSHV